MGIPSMEDLAFSISMKSASVSATPAMVFRAATAALSGAVQVGDLKFTVSLRMAESMAPAISLGRATLLFLNISYSTVQVQPTGWALKTIGLLVVISPILW